MVSTHTKIRAVNRSVLVLNPKGGCGKSTIAINIAGYFSLKGRQVALADCDPQGSSSTWLADRPSQAPKIDLITAEAGHIEVPKATEFLVIDPPAGVGGEQLNQFLMYAHALVIPVLASPIDIRAAGHFVHKVLAQSRQINKRIKIVTVANCVREDTLVAARLDYYLDKLSLPNGTPIPYITLLRQSQNYIRAAEQGLSIFEFSPALTRYDRMQWEPLLRWISSSRSLPAGSSR